jgi:hypothetical protein
MSHFGVSMRHVAYVPKPPTFDNAKPRDNASGYVEIMPGGSRIA